MKKLLSLFLFSALLTFCPQTMEGKSKSAKKPKKEKVQKFKTEDIYLFGFAFSFADSAVYVTDIQHIQGVQMGSHGMLHQRNLYSDQMKQHLTTTGFATPTCMVFYGNSSEKVNKRMQKLMKRYAKRYNVLWRILPLQDFQFVNPDAATAK